MPISPNIPNLSELNAYLTGDVGAITIDGNEPIYAHNIADMAEEHLVSPTVRANIGVTPLPTIGKVCPELFCSQDYIGIELELEKISHIDLQDMLGDRWEVVRENSLKMNGNELRFNGALCGSHIIDALDTLQRTFKKLSITPYTAGNRGSTHITINIGDMTLAELYNFIFLSYFCEPLLLQMCNKDRGNNSFAIGVSRTKDAKFILDRVAKGYLDFDTNYFKYRAIGLNSIFTKGGLEFRMFHATSSTPQLLEWINFIQEMKDIAGRKKTKSTVMSCMEQGLDKTLKKLFGRDMEVTHKASGQMWDFVREFTHNPIEDMPMNPSISEFYKKVWR